uniref:MYND-type domain-containing protein n=1 Tax=Moniliophthora roreri TaxID=221103 RepID=A0A0W0FHU4_MONRR
MLLPKKRGYPLWNPTVSNTLPHEYRKQGVSIGDVGAIDDEGSFEYFFNILLPAHHPCNQAGGVPDGFTPLSVNLRKKEGSTSPGTHIANPEWDICKTRLGYHEVEMGTELHAALRTGKIPAEVGYGFRFDFKSSEGAILILPEGYISEDNLNEDDFDNYVAANAISWYTHVNNVLGRRLGGNSLLLVTGVDKTSAWGVASFHHAEKGTVNMSMVPNAHTQSKYWFCSVSCATARSGPSRNNLKTDEFTVESRDQCVFVRGIRVSVRPAIFKSGLRMSVKTDSLQELSTGDILSRRGFIPCQGKRSPELPKPQANGGKRDPGRSVLSEIETTVITDRIPPKSLPYHPLAVINEHLLDKHPTADVVLSHDSCWFSLIKNGEDSLPNDVELLRRVRDKYNVVLSNGVIRLLPIEGKNNQLHLMPRMESLAISLPCKSYEDDSGKAINSQAHLPFTKETTLPQKSAPAKNNDSTLTYAHKQRGYRICDQCGKIETPIAKFRLCGSCMTAKYCSQECQKSHWPSHKPICQNTRSQTAKAADAYAMPPDENVAKSLRKFVSAHTSLLTWTGFQALQLKRVPSNIRQNAFLVELTPQSHPEPHRCFSVAATHIVPRKYIRDPFILNDIQRREDRCRQSGGLGVLVIIVQCGSVSQVIPAEVDSPSTISWDIRNDWKQVLHHFVNAGRTDFQPITTTPRGVVYG